MRNLRRADLIALGTVLGLTYTTMSNGDDFLSQVVAAWLNQQDSVLSQSGEPTWRVLADKLEEIGHVEITTDIRKKHDGRQYRGESEQLDDNLSAVLSMDSSDSLVDNQQSYLIEQSCGRHCSDQIRASISTLSVTPSERDQSLHTR